jgi:prepilin-type processing-associated H-X9-DG protein
MTDITDIDTYLWMALEALLNDGRNDWESSNLEIINVAFYDGHADIALQGEYFGVGDVTLIAARMQILLTVFTHPSVQTATITINGDTVGNLGVSHNANAKPDNYVFTREEIETYMDEHAYVSP